MAVKTICIGIKRSPKSSLADVSEAFYINEHLRLTHKLLIRDVLLAAKTKKQKYVWVKNSAIFCRKDDASRIVMIKNRSSIDKILFLFFLTLWINCWFMDRILMVCAQKRHDSRSIHRALKLMFISSRKVICVAE